jgi:hypothetical protein
MAPGLRNLWYGGFNAISQTFLGKPIFAPTWNEKKYIQLREPPGVLGTFLYPDHVTYDESKGSASFFTESTIQYRSDYEGVFGYNISGEYGSDFASVSGDTDYTYEGTVFMDTETVSEIGFFICKTGGFRLNGFAPLDPAFEDALVAAAANPPGSAAWTYLFDAYGTHILLRADVGGYFLIHSQIAKSDYSAATDVHASFCATFRGFLDTSSAGLSTSAFVSCANSSLSVKATSVMVFKGGVPEPFAPEFFTTCLYQPIPLLFDAPGICRRPELVPITQAIATPDLRVLAEMALRRYLGGSSLIGLPQPTPVNAVQVAQADGVLVVNGTATTDGGGNVTPDRIAIVLNPNGAKPMTVAVADCTENTKCVWAPIKKGDSYIATSKRAIGQPGIATASLLPLGNSMTSVLGGRDQTLSPINFDPNAHTWTYTPTKDGFLSIVYSQAEGGPNQTTLTLATDAYSVGANVSPSGSDRHISACVPVMVGAQLTVSAVNLPDTYSAHYWFTPFEHVQWALPANGPPRPPCGEAVNTQSDAVIICNLIPPTNGWTSGDTASVSLFAGPTLTAVTGDGASLWNALTLNMEQGIQLGIATIAAGDWLYSTMSSTASPTPAVSPALMLFGIRQPETAATGHGATPSVKRPGTAFVQGFLASTAAPSPPSSRSI